MKTTIISLGGSVIVPDKIDIPFLKKLKKLILSFAKKGNRIILVCGGGSVCRKYQQASEKLTKSTSVDKDWIGIMATRLNAELIRVMFQKQSYEKVIYNPHDKIRTRKKIIIAAGFEPGCSTDTDAVILAKQFNASLIINTTNTDYVYDKDPNKYKNAQIIKDLTWPEFKRIIGGNFKPGMHAPFDPVASKLAMTHGMTVAIINGRNLSNLKKLMDGKEFIGSIIG